MGLKFKLGEAEGLKQVAGGSEKKQQQPRTNVQRVQMNVQDHFLNTLRKEGQKIVITLMDGMRIEGKISGFDTFSILLENGNELKLIYKHAISMIEKFHS